MMAKEARSLNRRRVKDWFSGLTYESQQSTLDELVAAFQVAKKERINKLEKELAPLIEVTKPFSANRTKVGKSISATQKQYGISQEAQQ
jgi:predicted  nucleic acid-binding Zn-ribbon protein